MPTPDAIIRPMPNNTLYHDDPDTREGLWEAVAVERDDTGAVIQDNPNDRILVTNASWTHAVRAARICNQELIQKQNKTKTDSNQ